MHINYEIFNRKVLQRRALLVVYHKLQPVNEALERRWHCLIMQNPGDAWQQSLPNLSVSDNLKPACPLAGTDTEYAVSGSTALPSSVLEPVNILKTSCQSGHQQYVSTPALFTPLVYTHTRLSEGAGSKRSQPKWQLQTTPLNQLMKHGSSSPLHA